MNLNEHDTIDDYRWLTTAAAEVHLAAAAKCTELHRAAELLRQHLSPARARLVTQQAALRARARDKFPAAERLFFTPIGLEQATDYWIARYKASRFPTEQPVADLCCGIGGDLMALSARGPALGIDRAAITAELAAANLARASNCRKVSVACQDVESFRASSVAAWHLDPDRRALGKRTAALERYEPGPDTAARLLRDTPHAAIKLAPATRLPDQWEQNAELEWISRGRECRQLVAWFGNLARRPGHRVASRIREDGDSPSQVSGHADEPIAVAPSLLEYLIDCDPAVRAARLRGALARTLDLAAVGPRSTFLTSSEPPGHGLTTSFRVVVEMAMDRRAVAAELRRRGVGRLEIKSRDVPVNPEQLRKRLKPAGPRNGTLILTRRAGKMVAIIAERVVAAGD